MIVLEVRTYVHECPLVKIFKDGRQTGDYALSNAGENPGVSFGLGLVRKSLESLQNGNE